MLCLIYLCKLNCDVNAQDFLHMSWLSYVACLVPNLKHSIYSDARENHQILLESENISSFWLVNELNDYFI